MEAISTAESGLPAALSIILTLFLVPLVSLSLFLRLRRKKHTIGVFHPYCDAGGGGERVLFCAVKHLPLDWRVVIYTGDAASGEDILARCKQRFGEGSTPLHPQDAKRIK